jgi:hypothetical protein
MRGHVSTLFGIVDSVRANAITKPSVNSRHIPLGIFSKKSTTIRDMVLQAHPATALVSMR